MDEERIGVVYQRNKNRSEMTMLRKKDDEQVVNDLIADNPMEDGSEVESDGVRQKKKRDDECVLPDMLEDDDYPGMEVQRFKKLKQTIEDVDSDKEESQDKESRAVRCEKKQSRRGHQVKSSYEIYEPHGLQRADFTDEDNTIQSQDIPERMQLRNVSVTAASDEELDEEAECIYKTAFIKYEANWEWGRPSKIKDEEGVSPVVISKMEKPDEIKPQIISKIRNALEFMRNQLFEVPFIAFYRKEYVLPELSTNDLWKIYQLDARFCSLKNQKGRLVNLFKNMREHQTDLICAVPEAPLSDSMRLITDDDIERIKVIKNADELKDMYTFFTLHYGEEVPAMKESLIKRRKVERQRAKGAAQVHAAAAEAVAERRDGEGMEDAVPPEIKPEDDIDDVGFWEETTIKRKIDSEAYGRYKKLGVGAFVKKFGLPLDKFAENLRDNYQRHEVEQYPRDPLEAATEICSAKLTEPEDVVKAAKFMMATEISWEPIVRRCVRQVFFERATISCAPTEKGQNKIDETHGCFTMKYLRDKPVRDLTGDQFLKLMLAEEDHLLTIKLGETIIGKRSPSYIEEVKQLFMTEEFSKNDRDWNTLRGECLETAFEKFLYPVLRKELRAKLVEDAKEHVLKACCSKLHNWLKVSPYKVSFPKKDEDEWDTSRGIRVLAIVYVHDYQQASFACIISPDGDPSDDLRLQNITKRRIAFREEADRDEKETDIAAIKNFIRNKKPHLIVIGGESPEAQIISEK